MMGNTAKKKIDHTVIIFGMLILVVIFITILSVINLNSNKIKGKMTETEVPQSYGQHYVLIADDVQESFWDEVYQGAKVRGKASDAEVERFGDQLGESYSAEELMEIAIASQVDGIILQGSESDLMRTYIDEAQEQGIPVVLLFADNSQSKRITYIGTSGMDLGREYGREVIRIATKDTRKVLLLVEEASEISNQNFIYTGLKQTIENEGNHLNLDIQTMAVDNKSAFSAEETIRDMFLNKEGLPDILVCLNEENTISAYQAVVDYNMVGKVNIVGYHTAPKILDAIDKEVVSASIAVDTEKIGETAVEVLNEYKATGYSNSYIAMDVLPVTKRNVEDYLKDESKKEMGK